jgi:hypothetical protein
MRKTLLAFPLICILAVTLACGLGPSGPTPLPPLPDLSGQWQLKISYQNNATDKAWAYSESIDSTTPFQVTSDDKLSGQGIGSYTPGAKIQNPIFNCEDHAPLPITTILNGQVKYVSSSEGTGEVFSIHLIVSYSQSLQPSAQCTASGVGSILIPMIATVELLNQRTAAALGTDFTVNSNGALTDIPVPGMIAWNVKGDGQVLLSVTRIK